jgi:hypothetical protein
MRHHQLMLKRLTLLLIITSWQIDRRGGCATYQTNY